MEQFPQNNGVEKKSGIFRIVGVGSEDERLILEFFQRRFSGNAFDEKFEKEKSPELEAVIRRISEYMPSFLQRYGGEALSISPEAVHVLDISKFNQAEQEQLRKSMGRAIMFYDPARQQIVSYVDYEEYRKLKFCQNLVHEIIHHNSFGSYGKVSEKYPSAETGIVFKTVSEDGKERQVPFVARRIGLNMISSDGRKIFLNDFDEALVNELTFRFDREFFTSFPELVEELKEREKFLREVPGEAKEYSGFAGRVSNVRTRKVDEGGKYVSTIETYSYPKEMAAFNQFLDDLYSQNNDQFSSREDVFAFVARAGLTGRILSFARLVEKTYGKGSFRIVSESTARE